MDSGIRLDHIDTSVRPQDDFFGWVNGLWLAQTDIPADRGRYGTFDILREAAEGDLRAILDEVVAASPDPSTSTGKVAALYASFMDQARVEALGANPLADDLAAVAQVRDVDGLVELLGRLHRVGVGGAVQVMVSTDDRQSDRYVVYLEQGGLGLPDESYYREERHAETRTAYLGHVGRMLTLAQVPDPDGAAQRVMALETRLAAGHWDTVTNRDPLKTYTLVDRAELGALTPGLDWTAYARGLQAPQGAFGQVVVRQPPFLTALATALHEEPLAVWREWLTWHVVHTYAAYLSEELVMESFDFYGRTLSGTPSIRDRWKRGVTVVDTLLGEALGELYVARHFPPAAKERMQVLVANLVEAFRRSFADRPWMGEETRAQALAKLEAFTPKVGHPDRWRDYAALTVLADDLVGNVRRATAFESDRRLAKLGSPVDRAEWFMTPQTVNAYYNPGMNEIVFPAAILQPPFFNVTADDAVNYGGIGSVIGHEIGHGFDDQGSRFDGSGNLRDWWTAQDRDRFDALAQALIAQFDSFEPASAPGHRVNGALTVGENIGDLAGLGVGLSAYRLACGDAEPPIKDDLTGVQRFFVGWAQVWMGKARPEEAVRLLALDPHAPQELRGGTVRNLREFHDAFDVHEGDRMWLAPEDRVQIF
jgi:putative endopeptidase